MKAGDRVVWRPTWDSAGDREGVVLVPPEGTVSTSTGSFQIGSSAVAIRFDEPINGATDYIIGTRNVQVIS